MDKEKEFYIIRNKNLAITISYLLNENFYTFDDTRVGMEGKKIYSFKNSNKLKNILNMIFDIKNN